MRIPEYVKIGGTKFRIVSVCNLNDGFRVLSGQIDYMKSEIRLNPDNEEQQRCLTLWHEILHALVTEYGLKFSGEDDE